MWPELKKIKKDIFDGAGGVYTTTLHKIYMRPHIPRSLSLRSSSSSTGQAYYYAICRIIQNCSPTETAPRLQCYRYQISIFGEMSIIVNYY